MIFNMTQEERKQLGINRITLCIEREKTKKKEHGKISDRVKVKLLTALKNNVLYQN